MNMFDRKITPVTAKKVGMPGKILTVLAIVVLIIIAIPALVLGFFYMLFSRAFKAGKRTFKMFNNHIQINL